MRENFEHRLEVQQKAEPERIAHLDQFFDAEQEVIAAQRDVLIEMRDGGDIDNAVVRQLQSQLDTHGQTDVVT